MSKLMIHLYMKQRSVSVCSKDDGMISDDQPVAIERTVAIAKCHKHKKKRHRDHTEDTHHSHKKHASSKLPPATNAVSWLCPNLRVRIISKDYCRGRYYNHKVCTVCPAYIVKFVFSIRSILLMSPALIPVCVELTMESYSMVSSLVRCSTILYIIVIN